MNIRLLLFGFALLLLGATAMQAQVKDYHFSICGVPITSANAGELEKIPGVTIKDSGQGVISYSPEEHTLVIKNVSLSAYGEEKIACLEISPLSKKPFTLYMEDGNDFEGTFGIKAAGDTHITGPGILDISSYFSSIWVSNGATFFLDGVTVGAYSYGVEGLGAVSGDPSGNAHLVVDAGNLEAGLGEGIQNSDVSVIAGFESIKLQSVKFDDPADAVLEKRAFEKDGTTYSKVFVMSDGNPALYVMIREGKKGNPAIICR